MSSSDSNNSTQRPDLAACFEQHKTWLRNVVAGRLMERQAVDDVMQEVALAACNSSTATLEIASGAPWLYRVAVRQSLLYRRKKGRQRKLVDGFATRGAPPKESREGDPLKWLMAEERQTNIRSAIERLSVRDREILMLKYTENWSYKQLADRLGVSVNTVEYRLLKARKQLRRELTAEGVDQVK